MTEIGIQDCIVWLERHRPTPLGGKMTSRWRGDDVLAHLRRLVELEAENVRLREAVHGATNVCLSAANNRTISREDRAIYSLLADGLRQAFGEPK